MIRILAYPDATAPLRSRLEARHYPSSEDYPGAATRVRRCTALLAAAACSTLLAACGSGSKDLAASPGPPQPVASFTVQPKYFIASVLYMPPGPASTITYGGGTALGTTVATTGNWSGAARAGVQIGLDTAYNPIEFGNFYQGASAQSVDVEQIHSGSWTTYNSPTSNGINHDEDLIVIFSGVNVNVSLYPSGEVAWGMDFSQLRQQALSTDGYEVPVGCLRSNSSIPAAACAPMLKKLTSWGITSAEFPTILGADPFADPNASQTPDPSRYVYLYSFEYLPDNHTIDLDLFNASTARNAQLASYRYAVSAVVSGLYVDGTLADPTLFTWTDSSTPSNLSGSTSPATIHISMPDSPYSGPAGVYVYLDTIFKTIMFSFVHPA